VSLALNDALEAKWRDIQRFISMEEGYGAARELTDFAELAAPLPNEQRLEWQHKIDSVTLSPASLNQAIARGTGEVDRLQRLVNDALDLIDDEIMLMLSTLMSLRSVEQYVRRKCEVPWASRLDVLTKKVDALRNSNEIGNIIRKCEKVMRINIEAHKR